jgi:3-oxoacyl-[acyl-carrier protein] reductase
MNIIITGSSKGIGYETAHLLSQSGLHKIIGIAGTLEPLIELEKKSFKKSFKGIVYDLNEIYTKPDDLINQIKIEFDNVDILINNAGKLINKPFISFSKEEIELLLGTNLLAPAELIRLLLPMMGIKNKSHIVNMGSMGGFQGSSKYPGLAWYSASKAALANLTESLSVELIEHNVSVNCLAIGAVDTPMLALAFPGYKAPVKPDEIAKFIAEFALTGHKFFNGKILPVALSNP